MRALENTPFPSKTHIHQARKPFRHAPRKFNLGLGALVKTLEPLTIRDISQGSNLSVDDSTKTDTRSQEKKTQRDSLTPVRTSQALSPKFSDPRNVPAKLESDLTTCRDSLPFAAKNQNSPRRQSPNLKQSTTAARVKPPFDPAHVWIEVATARPCVWGINGTTPRD